MRRRALAVAALALATALPSAHAASAQPATWNFTQADIPAAQAPAGYGRGVTVAVINSGVDSTHPEFGGRVLAGADCSSGTCTPGGAAPSACGESWHGTHVAGTVASKDYGVAPEATILPVKVLTGSDPNTNCSATSDAVAAGIRWAADNGAQVENLSLGESVPGLEQASAITDAVAYAAGKGVVVVFAAGNGDPVGLGVGLPVSDNYGDNALIVAATGPSGSLASYSNSASSVNVAAPGGDWDGSTADAPSQEVLSTYPGNQLAYAQGTSMATPHVSGLAALLLSQAPGRGRTDVINAIESTAKPLSGAGSGLIDAAKAVALRPAVSVPAPTSGGSGTTTAKKTVVRTFAGCPKTVSGAKGSRPVFRCRLTPGASGLVVLVQQRVGKSYKVVQQIKASKDGTFSVKLPALKGNGVWRLQYGVGAHRPTSGFAVRLR